MPNREYILLPEQLEALRRESEELCNYQGKLLAEKTIANADCGSRVGSDGFSTFDNILINDISNTAKRAKELSYILKNHVVLATYDSQSVQIGTKVKLVLDYGNGDIERNDYILVEELHGINNSNYVSINSFVGRAALGKDQGETFDVFGDKGLMAKGVVVNIYESREQESIVCDNQKSR